MGDNMLGNGKIIICMEKVYIHGKMEENMKDNMNMIKYLKLSKLLEMWFWNLCLG